jgi:hypothetical protein
MPGVQSALQDPTAPRAGPEAGELVGIDVSEELFYQPDRAPKAARQPKRGDLLFKFVRPSDKSPMSCELRDHGEFGVEAQFLLNGNLYIARTFQDQPDLDLRARTLAIAWAE